MEDNNFKVKIFMVIHKSTKNLTLENFRLYSTIHIYVVQMYDEGEILVNSLSLKVGEEQISI